MRKIRTCLLPSAVLIALVPAAAANAAQPHRGLAATYPHASKLCARVDAGHAPKRIAASADQVTAACQTLDAAYAAAQADFTTATAPLVDQAGTAVSAARTACAQARQAGDRSACRTAIQQAKQTLRGLRVQARGANRTYHAAVVAARKAFWGAIHGLRGGAGLTSDSSTPNAAPSTPLPGDGALPQA